MTLARDPLRTVRDALEQHNCNPTGPLHKSVARCPAHEDRSPSLSIGEGSDGRALLHCFAGCDTRDIVRALELAWNDLFPPSHRNAKPNPVLAKPRAPIELILDALRCVGIEYRCTASPDMWVAENCPACARYAPTAYPLWIQQASGRVRLSCFSGCTQTEILAALTGRSS